MSFAAVQALVQVLSILTGFVLVRHLTKEDYAWFTIASGMTAGLSILADSGIGSAVTSLAGSVWENGKRLADLMAAALCARVRSSALAVVLLLPTTFYLLCRNHAPVLTAVVITVLVVLPLGWVTRISVLTVVNRMHHRTREIQIAELAAASSRSVFTILPTVMGYGSAIVAMGAMCVSHWFQARMVKRQVEPLLVHGAAMPDEEDFAPRIRRIMRQMLPSCLFVAFQGQLSIMLISVFASNSQVADLGALTRLGIVFTIAGAPMAQLVPPRIAKCQSARRLGWMIGLVAGAYAVFASGVLCLIYFESGWFLWLLGPAYAHLHHELLLVTVAASLGGMNSAMWCMNFARGWTRYAWLNVPVSLVLQVVGVLVFRVDTVAGVAMMVIVVCSGQLLHSVGVAICGLRSVFRQTSKKIYS